MQCKRFLSCFFHSAQVGAGISPGFCRSLNFKKLACLLRMVTKKMQPEICPSVKCPLMQYLLIHYISYENSPNCSFLQSHVAKESPLSLVHTRSIFTIWCNEPSKHNALPSPHTATPCDCCVLIGLTWFWWSEAFSLPSLSVLTTANYGEAFLTYNYMEDKSRL